MTNSDIKIWTVKEPYINLHCGLGEAPYFESERNHLRFVDIKKRRLHTIDLSKGPGSLKTIQFDMPVGVTADIEGVDSSKKILVGGKSGIYLLDRETGKTHLLKRFYDTEERDERLRSNDGAVDPQGRFWIGTMNDFWVGEPQAEGTLFRYDNDLKRHTLRDGLTIPNGIGWSQDYKTLYFTHSTEKRILAFDYNDSTGCITNERTFWKHEGPGDPDGFKMDADGFIWQAIYGEGKVLRISPEGKVVAEVQCPTNSLSCPVFVGTELWVTSADDDFGTEKEGSTLGGALFKVDVGIGGLPDFKFRLKKEIKEL